MNTRDMLISAYAGMLVGLALILAGLVWAHVRRQRMPPPSRTVCATCREHTPPADLTDGVCWACEHNAAVLIVDAPVREAAEPVVPGWLIEQVNAAAQPR